MDNLDENEKVTADTAAAERDLAAPELGKFKDVKTLYKAYSELEAEFTRRSQRLRELENGNKERIKPDEEKPAPSPSDEDIINAVKQNARVRDAVIGEYLKEVAKSKSVPLAVSGGGVAAPRILPKSVKEAGKLAQEFLNK